MRHIYLTLSAAILFAMAAALQAQSIAPASVTLRPSKTQTFSVNSGKGHYVWSTNPSSGAGSITAAGLYTAPSSIKSVSTVTVYATAGGRPKLSATVTLTPQVSISVSPAWISLTNGQSAAFSATVTGATNTAVTWSTPTVGSVTSGGVYTVPLSFTSRQNIMLTAKSVVDPTKTATVTIALVPSISVTLNPTRTTLTAGQSIALNAVVNGTTNTGLNWSLSPQVGQLSNGIYTAPASISSLQNVTVTATSQASTGAGSSVSLLLMPVSIAVTPTSASLTSGQSATFRVSVNGTSNPFVNWTVTPAVGTVTNGVYTAPALVTKDQAVTVTATSATDSTKSASATVSLTASTSITMTPSTASLTAGQSTTLIATVSGLSNTSVNWSMSPTVGTLSNGVYTAPANIASAQTLTVTAASAVDPTQNASAKIALVPVAVTVSPSRASLTAGQSATLKASVSGSSNLGVNWSLSPSVGTIVNGVYTAPATISSAQMVTVLAASAADPTKTASAAISLVATSAAVSISLTPSSTSLNGGQSATFAATVNGTSNLGVNWTLAPPIGQITNGVYTAPAVILQQQQVTVAAASAADPTKIATAAITLVPTVSVAVVPPSATLSASQSTQFNASLSGTTNPNVAWSMSPQIGSLGNGLYQAPTTINTQQIVTVTAASLADPTKTGSATITLVPTVGIALTPSSTSLTGGQSTQFNVSIGGVSSTAVTWTLAPPTGTISNGVYTAPVTINSLQTIVLTVASIADPTQTATANITLTSGAPAKGVSPSIATLGPSQTQQFTATGLGASPKWQTSPGTGSITSGGLYTAPSTITTPTTITVIATNATDSTQTASATVTLNTAASQTPPPPTTITLPVEVVGPDGYAASVSFNIPSGTDLSSLKLWMRIHGLRTQTQASLQLNNGAWQPISQGNVTLLGLAASYGGIGGGFHTLEMTMPATSLTTGTNTLTFRFNGTDGAVSGFRVLAFNVQDASGNSLIPSSTFVNDDPDTWQPPSTAQSDISAGQTLWQTAPLTVPTTSGHSPIRAHCMDCHAQDGRDLKYFNYSNNSIQARSLFHGLTAAQGDQIASYIRSLNVPNPGRPWNPPYQPGPGLDSQPAANWSAGAGLEAVLASDADMLPYLTPGGSTAGWAADQYLNQREIPIALQLPDWNSWLPAIHPIDAFGSRFTNSKFYTYYAKVRSELVPNDPTAYKNSLIAFYDWSVAEGPFMVPLNTNANWNANNLRTKLYSTSLWNMVKLWELNQEFGLEAMPQVVFGSKANIRGWYGSQPFYTSPTLQHIPAGPGLGNGSNVAQVYLSFIWYEMQLILNDGQGQEVDHSPIDFGYTAGRIKDLANAANNPPGINLELEWIVKALQEETLTGNGPEKGQAGWHPVWPSPATLVNGAWNALWSAYSPSQRASLTTDYVNAWFAEIQNFTPQQFYKGGWARANEDPALLDFGTTFGGQIWFMLPRLRYYGVDPNLTYQISAWAAKIWPKGNWNFNNSATCSTGLSCTSGY